MKTCTAPGCTPGAAIASLHLQHRQLHWKFLSVRDRVSKTGWPTHPGLSRTLLVLHWKSQILGTPQFQANWNSWSPWRRHPSPLSFSLCRLSNCMLSPGTSILTEGHGIGWWVTIFHGSSGGGGWTRCPAAQSGLGPQQPSYQDLCCPFVFPKSGLPASHPFCDIIYSKKKSLFSVTSRSDVFHLYIKVLADYNYNSNNNYHFFHH